MSDVLTTRGSRRSLLRSLAGGGLALAASSRRRELAASTSTAWTDFARAWTALAPAAGFLAAELDPGQSELFLLDGRRRGSGDVSTLPGRLLAARNATMPLAIASGFKLYVLGELARQVAQGAAAWDEPLTLREDWKSLPSGNMLYEPAGKVFPLQFYAAQMIQYSDNTATDHLLRRLGREQVEGTQAILGHATPARNLPFLLTREFFALKAALSDADVQAYLAASVPERRRQLATEVDLVPLTEDDDLWTVPLRIAAIEWFAAPADLCRALRGLWDLGRQVGLGPVLDLLALDPGLDLAPDTWPYVGFKGGEETGVLSRSWLLRRRDDRWFTFAAILNDPVNPLDAGAARTMLTGALGLLAATP